MALYHADGGVAGIVNVAADRWCVGISATAADDVVDATIQVNNDDPVPVPPGGAANLHPPLGTSKAPTITFTNTASYGVETVE